MSARFAGSRSLDDRRRRRLATEAGDEVKSTSGRTRRSTKPKTQEEEPRLQITHFPLRKLISPRRWKIWAITLAVLAVNAGILWAAVKIGPEAAEYGPNVVRLIDLESGRLPSLLCAGCLFLAAETAVFIYWIRSRSPYDFGGSFRVWMWGSATFCVLGCLAVSQAHLAWSQIVCRFWAAQFPYRETWCWLMPIACCVVPIAVRLLRDMRASRTSSAFFVFAGAACFASIGWQFNLWTWPIDSETRILAEAVAMVLTGWAVFSAMLHHARHVLHVSTDPPEVLLKARTEKRAEQKAGDSADQEESPQGWWAARKMRRDAERAAREAKREQQRQEKADRLAEKERLKAEQKAAAEQARADEQAAAEQAKAEKAAAKEQARRDAIAAKEQAKADAEAARQAEAEKREAEKIKAEAAKAEAAKIEKAKAEKAKAEAEAAKKSAAPRAEPKLAELETETQPNPPATKSQNRNTVQSQMPELRTANGEPFDPNQPLTDDMLKGLSKSQKRKLRKAYREAQRQDNAA